jgi:hypothetical protein
MWNGKGKYVASELTVYILKRYSSWRDNPSYILNVHRAVGFLCYNWTCNFYGWKFNLAGLKAESLSSKLSERDRIRVNLRKKSSIIYL